MTLNKTEIEKDEAKKLFIQVTKNLVENGYDPFKILDKVMDKNDFNKITN